MDDASKNTGTQQPTAENTENTESADNYQQFLGSLRPTEPPPKSRKKLIIVIVVCLVLLLAGAAAVLLMQNKTVACADENCFNQSFSECSPAAYTFSEDGNSVKYTITGQGEVGCQVTVEQLKAKYASDQVGKKMSCDFDNRLDFTTAAQNTFRHPDDYGCQGDLADIVRNSNDIASEP